MDGEAILAVIDAHGPAQAKEIVGLLAAEGVETTTDATTSALRKLESAGKVAHTPRDNWRLTGERARAHSAARQAARRPASSGVRTRALIYCPEILRDVPRLKRNTALHYVSYENGGFRLRDYVDGHRVEISEVAGIDKTVFLEAAYNWTQFDFDAEELQTPLTDNEFWTKRLAEMNASHAKLLAAGKKVVEDKSA
jgi:hypothetical protein